MSGTVIVRDLLASYAPLLALVPAARIFSGQIPQQTTLPAISIRPVSTNEKETVARRLKTKMQDERVQVTVYAKEFTTMERILRVTSLGPGVHSGIVKGYKVNNVLPAGIGPYIGPDGDEIHERSRDFMVTFKEAN